MVEVRAGSNYFELNDKRSDLAFPNIITGSMPYSVPFGGKRFDTKRNYEKAVARIGGAIVGFDKRWQEHIKPPQPYGGEKAHEASIVADVKKSIEIEASKMPPAGGLADRRLMRKQRRQAREAV
jgi:hypothetical protein